jgi:hypothetical protein
MGAFNTGFDTVNLHPLPRPLLKLANFSATDLKGDAGSAAAPPPLASSARVAVREKDGATE